MVGARPVLMSLAILLGASSARAQRSVSPPVELGVDAAVTISFDPTVTVVNVPLSQIRAGFFATPAVELEPQLGLFSVSGDGGHFTSLQLDLGLLYHFSTSRAVTQTYVRPFAGIVSNSGDNNSTATLLGIGLGAKVPLGNRFAFRPEVNFSHTSERGLFPASNALQFLFGLSVYTH